jgi:cytochrome c-type biogenesis protein
MILDLSILIALVAGLVSFLSPCILPIIPGFLAYLSGSSLNSDGGKISRLPIFLNSLFFVLGFSVVFALLGILLNTLLEAIAYDVQIWLARIGGAIVIFFGLYLMGIVNIGFLNREHKIAVKKKFKSRYLTSFVFGSAFAAGWTPCVGAALGAILGLAATNPGSAFILLLAYSIGLGIPFLVVGAFASQAANVINKYAKVLKYVNMAFGVVLVVLGVLVFTQSLNLIANFDFVNNILLEI